LAPWPILKAGVSAGAAKLLATHSNDSEIEFRGFRNLIQEQIQKLVSSLARPNGSPANPKHDPNQPTNQPLAIA